MSADDTPLIRCSVMRDNLKSLAKMNEEVRSAVLALYTDEERKRILSGIGWVPAELDHRYNLGLLRTLGTREAFAAMRWIIRDQLHSPLLGPIIVPALRLFGTSPGSILRIAPKAWPLVYRNCGFLRVKDKQEDAIVMQWVDMPVYIAENRAIAAMWACVFEAAGAFLDIPTRGRLTALVDRTGTYRIRWQERNAQFLDDEESKELLLPHQELESRA